MSYVGSTGTRSLRIDRAEATETGNQALPSVSLRTEITLHQKLAPTNSGQPFLFQFPFSCFIHWMNPFSYIPVTFSKKLIELPATYSFEIRILKVAALSLCVVNHEIAVDFNIFI